MTFTHASIVPLIGGETIGMQNAFGNRPEYILSYSPFVNNDSHLLNYYNHEVPYILLDTDEGSAYKPKHVDVVSAVCPCAGLSSLSPSSSADSAVNDWMEITARYVLENIKPKVFWGENAPHFATNKGKKIREKIRKIGFDSGYSMSVIKTKSIVHGLPQIRSRSFYFFWQDESAPVFNYYKRPHVKIEDLILGVTSNSMREPINTKLPSDNRYLMFILDKEQCTIDEFYDNLKSSIDVIGYIERKWKWTEVSEWMSERGFEREAKACLYKQSKIDAGKGYMKKDLVLAKDHIGAFVGHYPTAVKHPKENRFIDFREAMTIMGLPQDFELLNPRKSSNHICQNVPVQTATDMATEVFEYLSGNREASGYKYLVQNNINQRIEEKDFSTKTLVDFT